MQVSLSRRASPSWTLHWARPCSPAMATVLGLGLSGVRRALVSHGSHYQSQFVCLCSWSVYETAISLFLDSEVVKQFPIKLSLSLEPPDGFSGIYLRHDMRRQLSNVSVSLLFQISWKNKRRKILAGKHELVSLIPSTKQTTKERKKERRINFNQTLIK